MIRGLNPQFGAALPAAGCVMRAASMAAKASVARFAAIDFPTADPAEVQNELCAMAEAMAGLAILLEDGADWALTGGRE